MTFYNDTVTLLDRTSVNRMPVTISDVISNGDLKPWRLRLTLKNTGVDGQVNSGEIKLHIDNRKTFVQADPILIDDLAKNKYLIEAKIIQRNPAGGSDLESKTFRFQLGSATITSSQSGGYILSITLQELQYRLKESVTARELRFISHRSAFNQRITIDHNLHQFQDGVLATITTNNLPDNILQEYVPQSPQTTEKLLNDVFKNLSEPSAVGGTYTDYYYDFDPDPNITLAINATADEIGRVSSNVVLDPLSIDPVSAESEQDAISDFLRYKNHVVLRGSPDGGSLPIETAKFSSKWLHVKLREEWSSGHTVQDKSGATWNYLLGDTVKKTTTLPSGKKLVRFFIAKKDVPTSSPSPTSPELTPTYWYEDFVLYPPFDKTGRYYTNDIVYHDNGSTIRFYQASENIHDFSLNKYRRWKITGTYPHLTTKSKHLVTATGFLKSPPTAGSGWTSLAGTVADRAYTVLSDDFAGWFDYSPWTKNLFAWETNMAGVKGGSTVLPNTADNRYVGFVPDWDIAKDIYDKNDYTDEFENVSIKWVHKKDINTQLQLTTDEMYHGQRVLVGIAPVGDFAGAPAYSVAQYDKTKTGSNKWRFSRAPITGDIILNLEDGKIYQYHSGAWNVAWEVERLAVTSGANQVGVPSNPQGKFHIVKDVYKTQGYEGTPNSAIEFRFAWDAERVDGQSASDTLDDKADFVRLNSRGAWLWFWNPFPRLPVSEGDASIDLSIGDLYGYKGNTSSIRSGFTTLNIYNNSTDRFQSILGWNNGINTEDMGKVSGISFKIRVGIWADGVSATNDDEFIDLVRPSLDVPNIPMIFWCIDMFDRIWFKKYTLRKNAEWDHVTIQFGDLNQSNLHIPRWDELAKLGFIPLTMFNYGLKEKEYSGVQFDWRFVRGWGTFYNGSYDDAGFYNGGIDNWYDSLEQFGKQLLSGAYQTGLFIYNSLVSIGSGKWSNINTDEQKPLASVFQRQATIAIDQLHYVKELIVNSDDQVVSNARTQVEYMGNVGDYEIAKSLAKGKKNRLSFFPQFFHLGSIGDVRLRIGKSFKIKGDRIPNHPSQYSAWSGATSYTTNQVVSYGGYSWRAKQASLNKQPDTNPLHWENLNELACAEVTHIIDHSGYRVEVLGRRKFFTTGEL